MNALSKKSITEDNPEYSDPGVGTGTGTCPEKFSVPETESRNSLVPGTVPKS